MTAPSAYLRPRRLADALAALAGERTAPVVLAGGTDVYPALVGKPADLDVLDIAAVEGLRGVVPQSDGRWRLGALTRWADLAKGDGLPPMFAGLRRAARAVGGAQIQNAGTVGGNLCNASPAADGVPNLLALDARVELASARGTRELALGDFVLGNRRTALAADELLTAVLVPEPRGEVRASFAKLGGRRHLVISIAMAAFAVELDGDGRIARAGVAVGACGPAAVRLGLLEGRLTGERLRPGVERAADGACLAPLSPIDDIRGTAAYRLDACLTLLRRGLAALAAPERAAA